MNRLLRPLPLCAGLALSCVFAAAACDKVPLLAPSGTVINLIVSGAAGESGTTSAGLNSTVDITAVLIENGTTSGTGTGTGATPSNPAAGTPVQNGTVVSFTTSLGTIEPAEAKTSNGKVTVTLKTNGESGTATITAYSGGARSTATVKIGATNAKTVSVTASPQNLPSNGGATTISARVDDVNGNGLAGVPVTFTTTSGSLNSSTATTNSGGIATTTLTTKAAADVTATVAGISGKTTVGVSTRATISVTGPSNAVSVSSPATFTITTGTTVAVTNVSINYGDGTATKSLGSISGSQAVTHFYADSGIRDVTVSATDPDGVLVSAGTQVAITNLSGNVTASPTTAVRGVTVVTFTATVTPSTASIDHYVWNFGDGEAEVQSPGNTQTHVFKSTVTPGIYTVTVTVYPLYGSAFPMTVQITVT
jgi:hypothetical protein